MTTQQVIPNEPSALAVIETMTPALIFGAGAIDPLLIRIRAEVTARASELTVETPTGRKEIASLAYKVARSKTFIDEQRKLLVKDEKERLKKIDAEGSRIWSELETLQTEVRQPLTDWENAEKDRVAKLETTVNALQDAADLGMNPSVDAIAARIETVEAFDTEACAEFTRRAELAKSDALHSLRNQLAVAQQREAERAELDKLRKEAAERAAKDEQDRKAREEKDRAEAYAQMLLKQAEEKAAKEKRDADAKAEAERVRMENEARQATEKAEREKREAEERAAKAEADAKAAAEKAESDRKAAELKAQQDQEAAIQRERERVEREKQAAADAEAKREANKRHCAKINREALSAFVEAGINETLAKTVIELIAKNQIPNIKITY